MLEMKGSSEPISIRVTATYIFFGNSLPKASESTDPAVLRRLVMFYQKQRPYVNGDVEALVRKETAAIIALMSIAYARARRRDSRNIWNALEEYNFQANWSFHVPRLVMENSESQQGPQHRVLQRVAALFRWMELRLARSPLMPVASAPVATVHPALVYNHWIKHERMHVRKLMAKDELTPFHDFCDYSNASSTNSRMIELIRSSVEIRLNARMDVDKMWMGIVFTPQKDDVPATAFEDLSSDLFFKCQPRSASSSSASAAAAAAGGD
jgi:hypothetical protein